MNQLLKFALGVLTITAFAGNSFATPLIVNGGDYGAGHSFFNDRGFYEVGWTDAGSNYPFPVDPSILASYDFGPYVDASGNPQDGTHVFVNDLTGEYGFYFEGMQVMLTPEAVALVAAISEPDPQQSTQRASAGLRSRASSRMAGIHAGVEPAAIIDPENSVHVEYNYIDTQLDTPGIGLAGSANVYSIGYERLVAGFLYLDLSYEYADESLRTAAGAAVNSDTHTVAASLSADLSNNLYGFLITGGAFSEGATNLGGVQLANADGSIFFINPGLGSTWSFGDFVIDGSVSYLYQNGSTRTTVGAATIAGGAQLDQVIVEAGATYNFTDKLYARFGAQYNNIVRNNFAPGTLLDTTWVQLNSEIGMNLDCGATIYAGHGYDAGHDVYDIHTLRAGFTYAF